MRIGLTYDLRSEWLAEGYSEEETAEFDREETVEAIESAIRALGHETDRIGGLRKLVSRLAEGGRWDLVFNFAEGLRGRSRESEVPAVLEAYGIPFTFSDAVALGVSLDKALAKRIMRDSGVPTPAFAVLTAPEEALRVGLEYPLFAKPVAEGTGKGVSARSRVTSAEELRDVVSELLSRFDQPVLVEEFLPGRELTVGILGTGPSARAIGALSVVMPAQGIEGVYSYEDKELCEELVRYSLAEGPEAEEACRVALAAWTALECRDGGRVDVRADRRGRMSVMEANPLAGLHPAHSDLPILASLVGISYVELIGEILRSAGSRIHPGASAGRAVRRA